MLIAWFHAIVVNYKVFVSFYLKNFVSHFNDDLYDFVWTTPKRMKIRTES